jgi:hypothetical protein
MSHHQLAAEYERLRRLREKVKQDYEHKSLHKSKDISQLSS